jgi:hypothetical protein
MSRRCAFVTRSRPWVSVITGNLGIAAVAAIGELSEPLVVIIALRAQPSHRKTMKKLENRPFFTIFNPVGWNVPLL